MRPDPADPTPTVLVTSEEDAAPPPGFATYLPGLPVVMVEQAALDEPTSRLFVGDPHCLEFPDWQPVVRCNRGWPLTA